MSKKLLALFLSLLFILNCATFAHFYVNDTKQKAAVAALETQTAENKAAAEAELAAVKAQTETEIAAVKAQTETEIAAVKAQAEADAAAAGTANDTLTKELATANADIGTLTTELAAANADIGTLTTELASASTAITTLTADLAAANAALSEANEAIAALQIQPEEDTVAVEPEEDTVAVEPEADAPAAEAAKSREPEPETVSVQIGDIVAFGTWGGEAVLWQVMEDKGDGTYILLSVKGLDAVPYNTEKTEVTWESCTLRTWLNDTFYHAAFSTSEMKKIRQSTVENPDGAATQDYVYLLSMKEAGRYFKLKNNKGESLLCKPVQTAIADGVYTVNREWVDKNQPDYSYPLQEGACAWWLRTPGRDRTYAAGIRYDGSIYTTGFNVNNTLVCVRPAICVQF